VFEEAVVRNATVLSLARFEIRSEEPLRSRAEATPNFGYASCPTEGDAGFSRRRRIRCDDESHAQGWNYRFVKRMEEEQPMNLNGQKSLAFFVVNWDCVGIFGRNFGRRDIHQRAGVILIGGQFTLPLDRLLRGILAHTVVPLFA